MKCEKCGNEYPSQYNFATPTICNECFSKLSQDEQLGYINSNAALFGQAPEALRVGFGRRLGAFMLDFAVLMIVTMIVYSSTGFFDSYMQFIKDVQAYASDTQMLSELQAQFMSENMVNFYFSNFLNLIYFSLEILIGASLGKLILGIQIAGDDRNKAGYFKLFFRFSIKYLYVFISILWLVTSLNALNAIMGLAALMFVVGCFFALGSKKKALHDKIAGTAVYYKKDIIDKEEEVELI